MNKLFHHHHEVEMFDPGLKSQMWIFEKPSKRKFNVKACIIGVLTGLLCGLVIWPFLPRYFQAQTTLVFRNPEQGDKVSFLKQDLDEKAIQSELDILASPVLTSEMIKKLGLQNDIELTTSSAFSPFTFITNAWSAGPRMDAGRNALLRLNIQHDRRSYTVRFGYLSKDAQKSAEMTALLSTLYLDELAARKNRQFARDADIARSRLLSATARQEQLSRSIDEIAKQSTSSEAQTILSDLLAEKAKIIQTANLARAQIEDALTRAANSDADAEIITPALTPLSPLFPDPLIFAVALISASLMLGLATGLFDFGHIFRTYKA